jgi:Skp family chaperone for outer membrane proteins
MKSNKMRLVLTGLFLCAAMPALAQDKPADEKKAVSAAAELDKDAAKPYGEKLVTEKIKTEFKVDDARVQGLREQKLGYGEISIALSLAEELPGGITDANVQKVMAMRQGPPVIGWGKIAKDLNLKLGPVISGVKKMSAEVRKQERKDAKMEKKGAEKNEKQERMEKHERNEKTERMEKTERPDKPGRGK